MADGKIRASYFINEMNCGAMCIRLRTRLVVNNQDGSGKETNRSNGSTYKV